LILLLAEQVDPWYFPKIYVYVERIEYRADNKHCLQMWKRNISKNIVVFFRK